MFDILIENHANVSAVFYEIGEEDMLKILSDPGITLGTDGVIISEDDMDHPRTFGTFTRALGRYARDGKIMPMETMIHKMTGLGAKNMGLMSKGRIEIGTDADLVIFDEEKIIDRATYMEPKLLSEGILSVWIAGEKVYESGKLTGKTPGRVLRAVNGIIY